MDEDTELEYDSEDDITNIVLNIGHSLPPNKGVVLEFTDGTTESGTHIQTAYSLYMVWKDRITNEVRLNKLQCDYNILEYPVGKIFTVQ